MMRCDFNIRKIVGFLSGGMCILAGLTSYAQEKSGQALLQKSLEEYRTGHFAQVFTLLDTDLEHWPVEERSQAYRILALSYFACDDETRCREMIGRMLETEPYYTAVLQDPLRFVSWVKEMQAGKMTLVTASQQAESPEEAPVPVTVITREMLADIGARTLKDALLAYVPGMSDVESTNEVNVAMRGIFSSGQQKILILLNGHRLNSRSTNGANPDYSISLEKIQQIEVLRGPASSLYGNVALTAVVNLITRNGNQAGGLRVMAGIGNFGQKRMDLLMGQRFMKTDFVVWGSLYRSDGQKIHVPEEQAVTDSFGIVAKGGTAILEGYKDFPSYDIGFTCSRGDFSLLFNQRYCKRIDPFAAVGSASGALYTYPEYARVEGGGIGYGVTNTQSELEWNRRVSSWNLDVALNFDLVKHNQLAAAGDSIPVLDKIRDATQLMGWQEFTVGMLIKAGREYKAGKWGKGNVLMGMQAEHLNVYASDCIIWKDYGVVHKNLDMLKTGCEDSYSFFIQVKHYLSRRWILSGGLRADYKVRANGRQIFAISPRMSLIYLTGGCWNFKGCVSRAFVDAPYFFRYTELPTFKADSALRPEYLTSVQWAYGYHGPGKHLSYEGVLFYNSFTDMIYRDKSIRNSSEIYKNAGQMKLVGWEHTLQYESGRWRMNGSVSALMALNHMENVCGHGRVDNIPPLMATVALSGGVWQKKKTEVRLNISGRYMMKQLSPVKNVYIGKRQKPAGTTDKNGAVHLSDYTLPSCWVMNMGMTGKINRWLFAVNGYNILNRIYSQGGSTPLPYRQQGRSVMLKIGVHLGK